VAADGEEDDKRKTRKARLVTTGTARSLGLIRGRL
jgi:hypothetical protein